MLVKMTIMYGSHDKTKKTSSNLFPEISHQQIIIFIYTISRLHT